MMLHTVAIIMLILLPGVYILLLVLNLSRKAYSGKNEIHAPKQREDAKSINENQYDILMGLARIGGADAMRKAFNKIKNSVLVNERGVTDILSCFPDGEEKNELFRRMIQDETNYVAALFLKAVNAEMAQALRDEMIRALRTGNKEVRAAAVKGLGSLGIDAPAQDLIHALEDGDWEVRALAARALGPIKVTEASMALYRALYDPEWWVRQNAAYALFEHPGFETLFILAAESGDEYAKDSVISVIEDVGSPVFLRALKVLAA